MAVPVRSPLGDLCARVATRLRQKALFVSEQMRAPSVVLEMSLLTEHRDRIQALVGELPRFEATLSTGVSHPFALYLSLCSLAGQLAILGDGLLPPVFAAYNHANPVVSFQEVVAFVNRMLDQGIPETYQAHPFQYKDGVYALAFQPEWVRRRLVLGMRASVGVTEKEMRAWGEECLIGSASLIPSLRDKRILGATRQYSERDPELIAVRGVILFTLDDVAEFIKAGDVLQVLNFGERGSAHRPLEMVLYVKGG
jgi:type VI secretion system protein ImpJ